VVGVEFEVPVEEELVGAEKEGAEPQAGSRILSLATSAGSCFDEFADGVFDDVSDNVGGV